MLLGPLESQVIDFAQCVALFALNVPDETVVALACDKNLALETINVRLQLPTGCADHWID